MAWCSASFGAHSCDGENMLFYPEMPCRGSEGDYGRNLFTRPDFGRLASFPGTLRGGLVVARFATSDAAAPCVGGALKTRFIVALQELKGLRRCPRRHGIRTFEARFNTLFRPGCNSSRR